MSKRTTATLLLATHGRILDTTTYMALFQRKPQSITAPPLYTIGLNRTLIIAGLGNPGKEYKGTRHNIGFEVIDALANKQEFESWIEKKDLKCWFTSKVIGNTRVILVKPTTYMNLSGEALRAVTHFYKVKAGDTLVVHDELDIPFGQIRTRVGGGSAGHNGIKSVTLHIGEDYSRVRIGIKAHTKLETLYWPSSTKKSRLICLLSLKKRFQF
jgi:peptidyl-tRNA hydrolase, PTH1 family